MASRFLPLSLFCVLALLRSLASMAEEALPDPRQQGLGPAQRLEALVERVRLEQKKVVTLEADFVQLKESAMLVEPVEAKGVFAYAAPDRVRWDYRTPDPMAILITNEEMTTWYRDINQAERVNVGRQSQRVLEYLGAGSTMDDLLQYFSISLTLPTDTTQPYFLQLSPLFDKVAKRIRGMSVWIDRERFLPIRLRYEEADGDVTDLRFENLRINADVPQERFELRLPTAVDVRTVDLDRPTGLY